MREDMTERIQKDLSQTGMRLRSAPTQVHFSKSGSKALLLENDTDPLAGGNPYARLKCKQ